ncbi:MAG: T9SS type A sorting domain-containing protein [Bacteroidales bacterium]|nr:T9SS type A sorting domain-containing protein [Bacteroidales bacterium]
MKNVFLFLTYFLLVSATSLFAQATYKVTFSANVVMDKIQVKNLNSGATKTLAKSDKVITLQEGKTAIATVGNPEFLKQTANNAVVVNMGNAGHLNLTLFSSNGTFVARYSNNVNAGQITFQIGAATGVYVLVATDGNQSASLKLSITQNSQPGIFEVMTKEPEIFLKSLNDVIYFEDGDEFEFTGYYCRQTDVKTAVITGDQKITFSFVKAAIPTVSTLEVIDISTSQITVKGVVISDNEADVTKRGFYCEKKQRVASSIYSLDNWIDIGKGTGEFSATFSKLTPGFTYYVGTYAMNDIGIGYGEEISIQTLPSVVTKKPIIKPIGKDTTEITFEGTVIDCPGEKITERGIIYNTDRNLLFYGQLMLIDNDATIGDFSASKSFRFNNWSNTLYARAYVKYDDGYVMYGEIDSVLLGTIPEISDRVTVTDITTTSATFVGNVKSDNGYEITERGIRVRWTERDSNEEHELKIPASEGGTGEFTVSCSELMPGRSYEVSTYATNMYGTAYGYGGSNRFQTPGIPHIVITDPDINVKDTWAAGKVLVIINSQTGFTYKGFCWSTSPNPTVEDHKTEITGGEDSVIIPIFPLNPETKYYVRGWVSSGKWGLQYGEDVCITTKAFDVKKENGAITAGFAISLSEQIYFSQGNLQYKASTNTWRFAENQWDYVGTQIPDSHGYTGGTVEGSDNANIASMYDGWIDLFGWGTSGFCYKQPYMTSTDNSQYGYVDSLMKHIAGTKYDWGVYNKISNGGNQAEQWRTLTKIEWEYLLEKRENASNKYGRACVNGINGVILLPDLWILPEGVTFTSGLGSLASQNNNYSLEDWNKMEANGAVFLPAAGSRDGTKVTADGGVYWSSSSYDKTNAWDIIILYGDINRAQRHKGFSVRLVKDVK